MQVLEGLDPVRKRPGMYIGSTGPTGLHHCVWEVVDNSVDEAMAGYATRIDITLLADGGCRVVDNGRGIPTDVHPVHKISGVEIALTKLHGGGKFGGDGYKVSGGLHGVGVSVVNALSTKLVVEVDRDGKRYMMTFADGGKPQGKLKVVGDAPRNGSGPRQGTTVTFWPDGSIFETTEFSARTIVERLQMMAFLNRGLEIRFKDERPDHDNEPVVYKYAGGIVDFVRHVNKSKESLFSKVGYLTDEDATSEVEVAFQWNTGYNTDGIHSFANGINTVEGGAHVEGFKAALTTAVNTYARAKNLLKEKDPNLQGEDFREGITAIVSVRLQEPYRRAPTRTRYPSPITWYSAPITRVSFANLESPCQPALKHDNDQQKRSTDDVFPEGVELERSLTAFEIECDEDESQQEHADEGTPDRADATGQERPANDNRRDRRELPADGADR